MSERCTCIKSMNELHEREWMMGLHNNGAICATSPPLFVFTFLEMCVEESVRLQATRKTTRTTGCPDVQSGTTSQHPQIAQTRSNVEPGECLKHCGMIPQRIMLSCTPWTLSSGLMCFVDLAGAPGPKSTKLVSASTV